MVVGDDPVVRFGICDFLRTQEYLLAEARTLNEAHQQFQIFQPDAAILDSNLPDGTPAELIEWFERHDICIPVFVLVGLHTRNFTIPMTYRGDARVLNKPVSVPLLERQLNKALEAERLRRQSESARCPSCHEGINPFLGTSSAIRKLSQLSHRLLTSDSSILIQGETGSGKGILANWIHRNGTRSGEAFQDLNCAGLSRDLLESELFGHRRGSFTGALENKLGLFEAANHGTLFLDEIGDIDLQVQSKLLKVLEEQRFRRLGEVRERLVDVRLISATRANVQQLVESGQFRDDLYYRLNVITITVPSLRERDEDIPHIARYLIEHISRECGRKPMTIESSALDALRRHSWPGNIRELRNALERAIQLSDHPSLTVEDFPFDRGLPVGAPPIMTGADRRMTLKQLQEIYIEMVLQEEGGSVERAARRLGIARSSLYNKLKSPPHPSTAMA